MAKLMAKLIAPSTRGLPRTIKKNFKVLAWLSSTREDGNIMASVSDEKKPLKVIADSNALFVPLQFKIDIFIELERVINRSFQLILLPQVKKELEILAQSDSPKASRNAIFALTLARKCTLVNVPLRPKEQTDDAIIRIAKRWETPVFTNDKQLRVKLRDISVPVIYVRQKSRLELDGLIS